MAAQRFLRMTETAGLAALAQDGQPVVEQHARLVEACARAGRPDLAQLFAEPVVGGRSAEGIKAVSWYTDLAGEPAALDTLQGADRAAAEARLRERLGEARAALADPALAPLLAQALVVPSAGDVMVLFGQVVLTNWGFAPPVAAASDEALQRHWMAVMGPYAGFALPVGAAPAPRPGAAAAAVAAPAAASLAAPAATVAVAPVAMAAAGSWQRPWAWALVSVLLLAIGLTVGALWWPWLAQALRPAPVVPTQALEVQRAVNQSLEEQIRKLREWARGDVCTAPNPLGDDPAAAPVRPVENEPPPAPLPRDGRTGDARPAAQKPPTLIGLLEAATALVVAPGRDKDGIGIGTAFFVTPGLLATNRHVVQGADPAAIYITNKALGRVRRATVAAMSPEDGRDYALLKLDGAAPPGTAQLRFVEAVEKLDPVVAAGYPSAVMSGDPKWQELLRGGDVTAVPELVVNGGQVNTIFEQRPPLVIHSAMMSQGNSGGPLVDPCGRVVGINTLIAFGGERAKLENLHQVNISLASGDLIRFLRDNGVQPTVSTGRCAQGEQAR